MKLDFVKKSLFLLLLLLVFLRQWQMQSEIDFWRDAFLKNQQDQLKFMDTTNSSIEHLAQAVDYHSDAIKKLSLR